jgi:hypothetical protein
MNCEFLFEMIQVFLCILSKVEAALSALGTWCVLEFSVLQLLHAMPVEHTCSYNLLFTIINHDMGFVRLTFFCCCKQ